MNVVQAVAAGVKALPGAGKAFAATQAAWRFFSNPRVTLSRLIEPLRESGRQGCDESRSPFALAVHDWSKLDFDGHTSKRNLPQLSHSQDRGYELTGVLLVDAENGAPLVPMGATIRSVEGMHSTETEAVQPRLPHLDQVLPWMTASRRWGLDRQCVMSSTARPTRSSTCGCGRVRGTCSWCGPTIDG